MFEKTMAVGRKYGPKLVAAGTSALMTAAVWAQTDPFDTVMSNAETKVGVYGAALGVLAGVSVIFFVGIKYIKKIPRAA